MVRLLVTGASGFLGSRLARIAAAEGHRVSGLTSRPEAAAAAGFEPIPCDWAAGLPVAALERSGPFDAVIHAAASVAVGGGSPQLYAANALTAADVAEACGRWSAHTVFLSSVSVYADESPLTPRSPVEPATHYGMSKLVGERLTRLAAGERCSIVRLGGLWGWEDRPTMFLNASIRAAAEGDEIRLDGPGDGLRSYLWADDAARAVLAVATAGAPALATYAGTEHREIRAYLADVADELGVTLRVGTGAPEADRQVLGDEWGSSTPFRTALREEVERHGPRR